MHGIVNFFGLVTVPPNQELIPESIQLRVQEFHKLSQESSLALYDNHYMHELPFWPGGTVLRDLLDFLVLGATLAQQLPTRSSLQTIFLVAIYGCAQQPKLQACGRIDFNGDPVGKGVWDECQHEAWKRFCSLLKETAKLNGCIDTPMRDNGSLELALLCGRNNRELIGRCHAQNSLKTCVVFCQIKA
eukprot:2747028-Amphidinium_carterae.2